MKASKFENKGCRFGDWPRIGFELVFRIASPWRRRKTASENGSAVKSLRTLGTFRCKTSPPECHVSNAQALRVFGLRMTLKDLPKSGEDWANKRCRFGDWQGAALKVCIWAESARIAPRQGCGALETLFEEVR